MGIVTKIDRTATVAGPATAVSESMSRRHTPTAPDDHGSPARPPDVAVAPVTGADALDAELGRLAALRRQGVLTAEEYAIAKAKLVGL